MRIHHAIPLLVLTVFGCVSSVMVDLADRPDPAPNASVRDLVSVFDVCGPGATGARFMPRDSWLCALTPSLALVGAMMRDLEQKKRDQIVPASPPPIIGHTRILDQSLCEVAEQPEVLAEIIHSYADGGNPPDPYYQPTWLPVPLHDETEAPAGAACPARPGDRHLCLFGQLALQPSPAPVVVIAPGLFDSQRQDYVQRAGASLFAQGFGVLLVDMRDHGHTLRTQPWAYATLGLLEGGDLVAVGRRLASTPGCTWHARRGVGALGFSAGGLAAIHAFLIDEAQQQDGREAVFSSGVVALSPLLDPQAAVAGLQSLDADGEPASCSIFTMLSVFGPESGSACLAEGSIRHLFMALAKQRLSSLATAGILRINGSASQGVADYFEPEHRLHRPYGVLGADELVGWIDPARLAGQLAELRQRPGRGSLYIVSSADDPVVGAGGMQTLADRLGADGCASKSASPVCSILVRFGGHASFSVISPARIRALLGTAFGSEHHRRAASRYSWELWIAD